VLCGAALVVLLVTGGGRSRAEEVGGQPAGESALMDAAPFDPVRATDAYLESVPKEEKLRSDAYFEGGYWLQLWGFLYGAGVFWLLLRFGWSARMRDRAERFTRARPLQTWIYWAQYLVLTSLLTFPLTVYQGFFREHQYGLAMQTFGPWLWDRVKEFGVGIILGGLLMMALYGVLRRAPRSWWVWATGVAVLFLIFSIAITPVFINPLFNTYTKLEDPSIKGPILSMAHANGIAASDVFQVDASRQTTRISANVSGFLGTERISLNDNLLRRCSLPEIQAVMGHEMGHYVLDHVGESILFFSLLIYVGFVGLRWSFDRIVARYGATWGVRGIGDVAGLPVLSLLLAVFFFVLTPITNSYIRANEYEADLFGLNASRQPDGFAQVALKLGEYRKLDPGPIEEWIFFDHPSGRTRIFTAMRWKAEEMRRSGPGGP
jgi:Zn-dependent protease with chaperone function